MRIRLFALGWMFILLPGIAQATLFPTTDPARFEGYVSINGENATNASILVYVDGVLNKIVTSNTLSYYVATAEGADGSTISFKVNGVSVNENASNFTSFSVTHKNLTITCSAEGAACITGYSWSDSGCSGSLVCCSDNVCRSSCATAAAASSGGGGGGGSGTSSGSQSVIIATVTQGIPAIASFSDALLVITKIDLTLSKNASNVRITVTNLNAPPTGVASPEGVLFKYADITTQNIAGSDIEQVKIRFRVNVSWYISNNLDPSTTKLNRYSNGVWAALKTVQVSSNDAIYYYFEADSPGLSTFAITASLKGTAPTTPIPEQLFDITFDLDSAVVEKPDKISARVSFNNFGLVPTLVDLTYTIIDSSGTEVYSEKGSVTVETEQLLTKSFETSALEAGGYTLVLKTVYNTNVTDEFRQAFEITERITPASSGILESTWTYVIGVVIALVAFLFYTVYRNKSYPDEDIIELKP